MYFGSDHLGEHQNLKIVEGDIRDTSKVANYCNGYDIFTSSMHIERLKF